MDYAAIDLQKTASQIRIITNGEIVDCRIPTTQDDRPLRQLDEEQVQPGAGQTRVLVRAELGRNV